MCEMKTAEDWKQYQIDLTAGFEKWKAAKYGTPKKLTEAEFLNKYRTCSRCVVQGTCHKNNIGWYEDWTVDGEYRPMANRQANCGTLKVCCRWDAETASAVLEALAKAKEKGEVE